MSATIKSCDIDTYFNQLPNPKLKNQGSIWIKFQEPIPCRNFQDKFVYYKIGKTFGIFTQRTLAVFNGKLFYYENDKANSTKGCCDMRNLYCGFFKTDHKYPYLLRLSNYNQLSDIYLSTKQQFQNLINFVSKYTVQINFDQQFQITEKIGEGTFAKVYKAKRKSNGKVYAIKAVKKLDKNSLSTLEQVKQQKLILEQCDSQYCNKYYEFFQDQQHYYLILEYIEGKNLMEIIKQQISLTLQNKITILKQILEGLNYIHSKKIINRDIKPQNVIVELNTFKPKLIDFGLALFSDENTSVESFKPCGTMGYIAPQVMNILQNRRMRYTSKLDIFSFGIVAHILLLGYNPLKGRQYEQSFQFDKQQLKLDANAINSQYGQSCVSFLKGLLQMSPINRLSAKQALKHQFLNSRNYQQTRDMISTIRKCSVDYEQQYVKLMYQTPKKIPKQRVYL